MAARYVGSALEAIAGSRRDRGSNQDRFSTRAETGGPRLHVQATGRSWLPAHQGEKVQRSGRVSITAQGFYRDRAGEQISPRPGTTQTARTHFSQPSPASR